MASKVIPCVAGLDIGNGYVKAAVAINGGKDEKFDFPSAVAYVTNTHDIKEKNIEKCLEDFHNEMDASFDSPLVKDATRRLFGKRGLSSGSVTEEFDVYSHLSKSKQDLFAILVLGTIAASTLKQYYAEKKELPTDILKVDVNIALALPIIEYKKYRKECMENFMSSTHMVMIHNFETPIRIEICFSSVGVAPEGGSAHLAINYYGEPFMESLLERVRKNGQALENITAKDVLSAKNIVGIDIGEGTVNFPVFRNGEFNPDASTTFDQGYGSVLNRALDRLQDKGLPFRSRKELADFINEKPNALTQTRWNSVMAIINEEIVAFTSEVTMQFVKVLSRVGTYTEVVYVYGGGATPVESILYQKLLDSTKTFGGSDIGYPILYLDSEYSRFLNREGLFVTAKM